MLQGSFDGRFLTVVEIDLVVLEAFQERTGHAGIVDDLCGVDGPHPCELEPALLRRPDRPVLILLELGRNPTAGGHFRPILIAELAAGRNLGLGRQVDRNLIGLQAIAQANDKNGRQHPPASCDSVSHGSLHVRN